MKLTSMRLQNYRCFENMEIHFDDKLTVLVGPNGSGKTAVLDAVAVFLKWYAFIYNRSVRVRDALETDVRLDAESAALAFAVQDSQKDTSNEFCFCIKDGKISLPSTIHLKKFKIEDTTNVPRPVVCYYSAKRFIAKNSEYGEPYPGTKYAYVNAFNRSIAFQQTQSWLISKYNEEARNIIATDDKSRIIPELLAVRMAVAEALGDYHDPYVIGTPPQICINRKQDGRRDMKKALTLPQLSDGYRTMLALVMDLARRMAVANADRQWPEGENVLHSPGIVLIDEVELHLHPGWQQTVLPRLMEIFPRVQFIVTTHSPQVVSSVDTERVRILGDGDTVYDAPQGIWGAEASRILKRVFGVDNRPPSQARDDLEEYSKLVYADQWDSPRALELRSILDARYGGEEPRLVELDMHIANRKWEMEDGGLGA